MGSLYPFGDITMPTTIVFPWNSIRVAASMVLLWTPERGACGDILWVSTTRFRGIIEVDIVQGGRLELL